MQKVLIFRYTQLHAAIIKVLDMKESEAMLLRIVYLMNSSTKLTENVTVQGLM